MTPALTAVQKSALAVRAAHAAREAGAAKAGSPAAVDMESAAWARACAEAGVPYLILRAISDTADEDLPGYLAGCMDAQGSIRRAGVASGALRHPGSIPALLRMRRARRRVRPRARRGDRGARRDDSSRVMAGRFASPPFLFESVLD